MTTLTDSKRDYWNRRLNRGGIATPTPREFVDVLNARLRADPASDSAVTFIVLRPDSDSATLAWSGPSSAQALVRRIVQSVAGDAAMPAPFQIDPVTPSSADA